MAQAFLHKKAGDVDAMAVELRRLRHSDDRLIELPSSKPNISDDFEMEGMAIAVNLLAACRGEIEEIDRLLDPANLERVRRTREMFGQPRLLEVRGEAGATFTVRFALPELRGDLKEARLTSAARDIDGEHVGEEATVSFLGREIGLAPTGDGLSSDFSFDLDPSAVGLGPVLSENSYVQPSGRMPVRSQVDDAPQAHLMAADQTAPGTSEGAHPHARQRLQPPVPRCSTERTLVVGYAALRE
jgi:hypothetical protein